MEKIIMIGAGGHAESVADSLDNKQYKLIGFIDSNKSGQHMGLPIFGKEITDVQDYQSYSYFVSIGDVGYRELWFKKLLELKLPVINIVDKTAIISPSASIGTGNFVGKLAIINAGSVMGDNNVPKSVKLILRIG